MDTLLRLNGLLGTEGLLHTNGGDFRFTFLAVHPPDKLPSGTDDEDAFQRAVSQSDFTIRFAEGTLIDGSDTKRVSGFYISKIFAPST
jgi:hypothetical protein